MKTIRRIAAIFFLLGITLLFLDFTGATYAWLSWMARLQFIPAVLSGSIVVVTAIVVATLLFGRIYCSVVCPLGVWQDGIAFIGRRVKRNRYRWSAARTRLRYISLVLFIIALLLGVSLIVYVLAPYSTYGRFVASTLSPLARYVNNLIAAASESSLIYHRDVLFKTGAVFFVSLGSISVVSLLAYRNGRTWCNTVCPVGTILGIISSYSLFKIRIAPDKCVRCGLCSRNCKSSCIDFKNHSIDYTRCVTCMDCIGKCSTGAITYSYKPKSETLKEPESTDTGRRNFLAATAIIASSAALRAKKKVDGGVAVIEDKKIPVRNTQIVPPGAESLKNVSRHCTACQLCITACPNRVLRPSGDPGSLMQPRSSFEQGYCRPECTRCSHVCPTGAIRPVTAAEKTTISVGHAVWIHDNCIPVTRGHNCNACERHCPTGAISRVPLDPANPESVLIPVVDTSKCIGCGACEYYCPARPLAAMYIEGNSRHIKL